MESAFALMFRIRDAIQAYRDKTGDKHFGCDVQGGKLRLVRVTDDAKGVSRVEPRSKFMVPAEWFRFMSQQ